MKSKCGAELSLNGPLLKLDPEILIETVQRGLRDVERSGKGLSRNLGFTIFSTCAVRCSIFPDIVHKSGAYPRRNSYSALFGDSSVSGVRVANNSGDG